MKIITTNTIWKTGSTIELIDDVEISTNVTLTVEAGVTINGNGHNITVLGKLIMNGTEAQSVTVYGSSINFGSNSVTPGYIELHHINMIGGYFSAPHGDAIYGFFDVEDSTFNSVGGFYIWYPTAPSTFSRNIFENSHGLSIGTTGVGTVTIENNVFASQTTPYAIEDWANYNGGLIVSKNSFLSTDRVALSLPENYSNSGMAATHNYFGTTDKATIDAMILDRADSLSRASLINYSSIPSQPDSLTPTYILNYTPIPITDSVGHVNIINVDTVWHIGSLNSLSAELQIAPGVTLTIESGAKIYGNGNKITALGNLIMNGTEAQSVTVYDSSISFGSNSVTPGYIELHHINMTGGSFSAPHGDAIYGFFDVEDSIFNSVGGFYIWYPTAPSTFSRNIFENSHGLSIGTTGVGTVTIANNVFASQTTPYAIEDWANYNSGLKVSKNSFLSTDRVALSLPENYSSSGMVATNNYFGTNDKETIDSMILDRADSLSRASLINYSPILSQPDSLTPFFNTKNFSPTGSFGFTGIATQGQVLTEFNTFEDVDGLGVVTFQWRAGGISIAGATSAAFVLSEDQVGKIITIVASYSDGGGTVESVISTPSTQVTNINDPPTGTLVVSGTATQGQKLTSANTLADIDGLGTIAYQWKAGGSPIANATNNSLVLTEAQVGKAVTVVASYTDGHGTVESVTSAASGLVVNVNDLPTGSLALSGTATQGQTLTVGQGSLADADGLGTVIFQWQADGNSIAAATGSSFVLTEAQVGKLIGVVASYTDGHGTAESVNSTATAAVVNVNDAGVLSLTGSPVLGQTLTVAAADADGLGPVSYRWLAEGAAIDGATSSTLVMAQAQVGHAITVTASYTDLHGTVELLTGSFGANVDMLAYSWNAHTLLSGISLSTDGHSDSTGAGGAAGFTAVVGTTMALTAVRAVPATEAAGTDQAVNLQDAIAILKMIVGLDVNGAGKALSPYQAYAADYDGSGKIELSDAIGVLKHVVGLDAPTPKWIFFNELDATVPTKANLLPGSVPSLSADLSGSGSIHVGLVGVLRGDVDGSYAGAAGAQDLDTDATHANYFALLLAAHKELSPSQFGVYPYP